MSGRSGDRALGRRSAARVLFDADCGFCTRSADWLETWSTAAVEPMQAVDLAALGVDPVRAERELPVILVCGEVVFGSDAIAAALASGPWWVRAAGFILRIPPIRSVARPVYGLVARNRHRLPGGTGDCRLP